MCELCQAKRKQERAVPDKLDAILKRLDRIDPAETSCPTVYCPGCNGVVRHVAEVANRDGLPGAHIYVCHECHSLLVYSAGTSQTVDMTWAWGKP